MTTKIDGPAADVDTSAAELARANERHTSLNLAESRKLDQIIGSDSAELESILALDAVKDEDRHVKVARMALDDLLMDQRIPTELALRIRRAAGECEVACHARGMQVGIGIMGVAIGGAL